MNLIFLQTLGCSKNLVDSEIMLGHLLKENYVIKNNPQEADYIIINTCGFIEAAKEESINTILELNRFKKQGNCQALIVAGCLAQKYKEELQKELPEIDVLIDTNQIEDLPIILRNLKNQNKIEENRELKTNYLYDHLTPRILTTPKHFAYVKIAEGCDNCCTYCVIPSIRGGYRSRTIESIVEEVRQLLNQGVKEIIFIAQDTSYYGMDRYGKLMLHELIRAVCSLKDLTWLRILYCYPNNLTEELIEVIATEAKVCKYIDLPLQHASNAILKQMGRRITKEEILQLIQTLRAKIPTITIRSTFIVGFPGETEEQFNELLDFIKAVEFERAGFFAYSQEPDTPAGKMKNQISEDEKSLRIEKIQLVQEEIMKSKQEAKQGDCFFVAIDEVFEEDNKYFVGRTEADSPEIDGLVYVKRNEFTKPGDFLEVRINHVHDFDLVGEICDESSK